MAMRRFLKAWQTLITKPSSITAHSWLTAAFRAASSGSEAYRPWTQWAARRRSPRVWRRRSEGPQFLGPEVHLLPQELLHGPRRMGGCYILLEHTFPLGKFFRAQGMNLVSGSRCSRPRGPWSTSTGPT
ncbi:Putative transposable element [Caligus rogercresseyi]|uniref:Transposable element n=1 Tax=Caligus rogercresseyi TaxID=217165 RepID=A0A7T8K2I4_CALRO|nr:Putative transposable element [Caligus rogercresseyi]